MVGESARWTVKTGAAWLRAPMMGGCGGRGRRAMVRQASEGAWESMAASMGGHHHAGRLGHLLQELALYDGPAVGLRIVTLGGFAISIDGEHIGNARWGRPKVQQLFRYLLTARNHSAHRDVLMEALWPELPVDAAWSNLKNGVYRLRRVLEPQLLPRQVSRFLVAEGLGCRLLLGSQDRWDAAEFLRQAEAA